MSVFAKINSLLSGGRSGHQDSVSFVEWNAFIIGISHLIKSGLDEKARMLTILCGSPDGNVSKTQLTEVSTWILDFEIRF